MDVTVDVEAPCSPDALLAVVDDLTTYPAWLEVVRAVVPETGPAGQAATAWDVTLQGRLGPLTRTKRLRMVRAAAGTGQVRFERSELDGREHSPWVLEAAVAAVPAGAGLHVRLHYGGALWGPVLERLLHDEIDRSRSRLLSLLAARSD